MWKKSCNSLFVGDVLLYLLEPERSISAVLDSMGVFSALSGYKINIGKLSLNISQNKLIQSPFQLSDEGLRYLGIFLTSDLSNL